MKLFLGHIYSLKEKCDYILVPRLFCINKNERVCTNFNALYDLVNNLFNIKIINYNVDITSHKYKFYEFIKIGKTLGFSYKDSYLSYKKTKKVSQLKRIKEEKKQRKSLNNDNIKILLVGHPYNLYDNLVGKVVINFLEENEITIIYSNKINHLIINSECKKLSTDIHWTHNKEIMASVNYYKDKVDGIILISSFPCGPDSLSNEFISRKVKVVDEEKPVIKLTDKNGHLMGALGVAILSKKEKKINFSFDIIQSNFNTNSVYCGGCPNNCEIICVRKDNILIDSWGNRCDRGRTI